MAGRTKAAKKGVSAFIEEAVDISKSGKKTPITPDKPGLATASRIAKKDAEIRKFAGTHGKAAAIKKYGKDRVDQVPMSTKTIGKPPSVSKAGEGPHGISGQPMTGKPGLSGVMGVGFFDGIKPSINFLFLLAINLLLFNHNHELQLDHLSF